MIRHFPLSLLLIFLVGCSKTPTANPSSSFHDLTFPIFETLRDLPDVENVEVLVPCQKPEHRIVHIRDWHFVEFDLFSLEARQTAEKEISDKEVQDLYQKHLNTVDGIAAEQEKLLVGLVQKHGLKTVFAEGVTPQNLANYKELIAAMADISKNLASLRIQMTELKKPPEKIEEELAAMESEFRKTFRKFGATGFLAAQGMIEVLPLDDDDLLQAGKPVTKEGKIREDQKRIEERHDGQLREVLKKGGVALIVLGGKHDLSESVRRLGAGKVEYIRVTTIQFRKVEGEK